jgi:hypothetical protein
MDGWLMVFHKSKQGCLDLFPFRETTNIVRLGVMFEWKHQNEA